jgi:hypothetical protein
MVVGEADDHVESKDPGAVNSSSGAAGSSLGKAHAFYTSRIPQIELHSENALRRLW